VIMSNSGVLPNPLSPAGVPAPPTTLRQSEPALILNTLDPTPLPTGPNRPSR